MFIHEIFGTLRVTASQPTINRGERQKDTERLERVFFWDVQYERRVAMDSIEINRYRNKREQ